eukprot:TRINITY_DN1674_c0_g1_i3.p1 TRINITY_DN1674_c0_g1~~TRINITY_DN1674_c0_g1_i3.p1  ORF type:complete len:108 (+),score=0.53 TRINITY_DN1674_c0_g1_i3:495-818(+)
MAVALPDTVNTGCLTHKIGLMFDELEGVMPDFSYEVHDDKDDIEKRSLNTLSLHADPKSLANSNSGKLSYSASLLMRQGSTKNVLVGREVGMRFGQGQDSCECRPES